MNNFKDLNRISVLICNPDTYIQKEDNRNSFIRYIDIVFSQNLQITEAIPFKHSVFPHLNAVYTAKPEYTVYSIVLSTILMIGVKEDLHCLALKPRK